MTTNRRHYLPLLVALGALILGAVCAQAQEREIGTTSAVNPQATGFPPVSPERELVIGTDVVTDERVVTTADGQAQMLFLDGSSLTIGPNSQVTLDKFVYDPDTKTGELAFTATKGLFRLVGGRISKTTQVVFKTPTATIGIRGGVVIIGQQEAGPVNVTYLFGEEATITNEEGTQTMRRPGFTVSVAGPDAAPSAPVPATPALLNTSLNGLEGRAGATGGAEEPPSQEGVEGASTEVVDTGSEVAPEDQTTADEVLTAEVDEVDPVVEEVENSGTGGSCAVGCVTGTGTSSGAVTVASQSVEGASGAPSDGVSVSDVTISISDVTVTEGGIAVFTITLSAPVAQDVTVAFSLSAGTAGSGDFDAITGTVTIPAGETSATIQVSTVDEGFALEGDETFFVNLTSIVSGPSNVEIADGQGLGTIQSATPAAAYVGRGKLATIIAIGTNDATASQNLGLSTTAIVSGGTLTASTSQGNYILPIPSTSGFFTVGNAQTPFGPASSTDPESGFLTADGEFIMWDLVGTSRQFVFAGVPTPASAFPSAGVTGYTLREDFALNSGIPFIPTLVGGSLTGPVDAGNVFIIWDAPTVFGGGLLVINGSGASQDSVMSVLGGRVLFDGAGLGFIQGGMQGASRIVATSQAHYFDSPLSSVDAAGGSDFFGTAGPLYFVLEASEVDSTDAILSRGAGEIFEGMGSAAYFPNVPALASTDPTATRTTRTLTGFVGGLAHQVSGATIVSTREIITSNQAATVATDATLNTVDVSFDFQVLGNNAFEFTFGGPMAGGEGSFFINDDIFGAVDDNREGLGLSTSGTFNPAGGPPPIDISEADFVLLTDFFLQSTGFVPSGVTFCDCQFLEWGFWGATVQIPGENDRLFDLATWVAGEASADAQVTGFTASATYNGHAIGSVNNNGSFYQAVGNIALSFTFGSSSFSPTLIQITDFDGIPLMEKSSGFSSFSTNLYVGSGPTGPHPTGGTVSANLGGKFFGPSTPPAETGGRFTLLRSGGPLYRASGIYAAAK